MMANIAHRSTIGMFNDRNFLLLAKTGNGDSCLGSAESPMCPSNHGTAFIQCNRFEPKPATSCHCSPGVSTAAHDGVQ